jgi:2-isopropylmalate synthase
VLGRHSGRHAVQSRCEALGFALTSADVDGVYRAVIALTERRKAISDHELRRIVEQRQAAIAEWKVQISD